jgi:hypothetical protein
MPTSTSSLARENRLIRLVCSLTAAAKWLILSEYMLERFSPDIGVRIFFKDRKTRQMDGRA